ncbi:MAG: hypothetical protein HC875_23725 [Anaerolineales bacterium]|nr:hypothetical protein [Anaerolineales bacterium]
MSHPIQHVAVIGAGTMGAAIAALFANAGLSVTLLDAVPTSLTPAEAEQGLDLTSPPVRNRLVQAGFERMRQAKPPALVNEAAADLITLGNTEDNFDQLAAADWVIEAIIEKLEPKRALLTRLEAVRKPGSFISSNTSGLPIASLTEGRSDDFKRHLLGTHFFNPPQYLKLLEIIPTPATDPAVIETIIRFGESVLGKGIVHCKDTPNFIGNRLFSLGNSYAIHYGFEHGYSIEEIDALTGPLLGRPKTATFRLQDLVGVDIAAHVAHNLYDLIPHDPYREVLRSPHMLKVTAELMTRGWLGNKSKQGFYKQGKDAEGQRIFMVLNPATFEYELTQNPRFESVETVSKIADLGQRLTALFDPSRQTDHAAQLAWAIVSFDLAYAAACAQEIAYTFKSLDDAMRWGFAHEAGPFQLWDKLGVAATAAKMEASGLTVAPWVKAMLAAGCPTFYRLENGQTTGFYDWDQGRYRDLP